MAFQIICDGCGQSLVAEEGWIGKKVTCPACQAPVLVEMGEETQPEPAMPEDDEYRLADAPDLRAGKRSTSTPILDDVDAPSAATDAAETECPACGVKIPAGDFECRSCRYNIQLGRRVDLFSGGDHYVGTVGFERYLLKRLHQTESLVGVIIWFHLAFAFVLGIVCLILREWWVAIPVVVLYAAYHLLSHANRYFYRGKSFIWWLFLRTGRVIRWRRLAGLKKRKYWTVHDPSFTDERLGRSDELEQLHIIDLQGTGISNDGLTQLEYLPLLEVLIVKSTNVTAAGVANLQLTNPDTCIWY